MAAPATMRNGAGALSRFGVRLGRDTTLYGCSSVVTFGLALATVAVLTRYLSLEQFAHLSLLYLLSTFLTVLYNLGSLQGTLMSAFGSAGGEDGAADSSGDGSGDPRRALGAGLVVTLATIAVGTVIVAIVAEQLGELVLNRPGQSAGVLLAAAAGGLGAVWRLALNVPRMERSPQAFAGLSALRPALVLVFSWLLAAQVGGVDAVLAGTVAANGLAVLAALILTRHSYRLTLQPDVALRLWRTGAFTVPFVVGVWVVHNVDLYLISRFLSEGEIARFRVASRIGAGMSYFVSAFMMALAPLTATTLYAAVRRMRREDDPDGTLFLYFGISALWILLALSVLSDWLIQIAPDSYGSAAPLIPLVAAGYVTFGTFVLFHRFGAFPNKRRWLPILAVVAAATFLGLGLLLVPAIGVYGAPLAQFAGFAVSTMMVMWLAHRAGTPIDVPVRRLVVAFAVALGLLFVGKAMESVAGGGRLLTSASAMALFPVLMLLIGVLPRSHLASALGSLRRPDPLDSSALAAVVRERDRLDGRALELLVRERRSPEEVAEVLGTSVPEVLRFTTETLRDVAGLGPGAPVIDEAIGEYLLGGATQAELDHLARRLWSSGVNPLDVDALAVALERIRRMPTTAW